MLKTLLRGHKQYQRVSEKQTGEASHGGALVDLTVTGYPLHISYG